MTIDALTPFGWDEGWAEALAAVDADAVPARVLRHDGVGLLLVTPDETKVVMLSQRLSPEPTVGDWVALSGGQPLAVLPRRSLLRRRAALRDREQSLAANIDVVLLVCGLDRPVKDGRIQRGASLASDAGAVPAVVLTKSQLLDDPSTAPQIAADVAAAHPGIAVVVVSVEEGEGLDALGDLVRGHTATMLGESGAGKSTIVNALLGADTAAIGRVREGDSKGRHTTTNRQLHLLPGGGSLIDTPGIRAIGLYVEPDKVTEAFGDIDAIAEECRFSNCSHTGEPGCAVALGVEEGRIEARRVEAWLDLRDEAEQSAQRRLDAERRRPDRARPGGPKTGTRRKRH